MPSVFETRINPYSNRPGNVKGVAGFMKEAELYRDKFRSESPASCTFNFNRLSNTNVKVLYNLFRIVSFVVYYAVSVD